MSIKNGCVLTKEGIEYLCGLIRDINGLDTKLIDDLNIKSNGSYSSLKISQLVDQALKDSKEYSDLLCSSLIKLTCKKTTTQPTLSNSEKNVIYLYSADGNAPFHQYLKISDTELIDMGSTSISLNDYLTITDAVATYCKKTDFDALKTEVTNIKTDLTSHTDDTDIHVTTADKTKWNEVDGKVDKTSIITAKDNLARDDQVYSAKAINTELDKKADTDKVGDNIIVVPHTQIGELYTIPPNILTRFEIDVTKSGYTCIGILSLQDNHGSYTQFKSWFIEENKVVIYVLSNEAFSDYIVLASLLYKKN